MVSERPYRNALTTAAAQKELINQSSKQFDPEVVKHFLGVLATREVAYRSSGDTNFQLEFQKVRLLEGVPD
jgi:HD-GYP domain-containing protein (c-di-GMP phosphodiesterase class II)